MSFEDLMQLPIYQRRVTNRKRVFMTFWMTSDEKKKKSKRKKKTLRRKQWQKQEK